MMKSELNILELKMIVERSIHNKMLPENIYICELGWDSESSMYCDISLLEEEYSIPKLFSITDMKINQLYDLGEVYCNLPVYFLFLDDDGNVHIHDSIIEEHSTIHALLKKSKPTDEVFYFAAL